MRSSGLEHHMTFYREFSVPKNMLLLSSEEPAWNCWFCLRTTYFQVEDKLFQQKDGTAMKSSVSPIVSNIYMKHFEKLSLNSAHQKPLLWLCYVDDKFLVWPHDPEQLQNFLSC
jgi:hypothetical protein